MKDRYDDIRSRINEEPAWYDQSGVPRYGEFSPEQSPNIYADQVCLVEIECQQCQERFLVEFSSDERQLLQMSPDAPPPGSLEQAVRRGRLGYGDPPNHRCTGDTMSSRSRRVVEFWRKPVAVGAKLARVTELEVPVKAAWEDEEEEKERR